MILLLAMAALAQDAPEIASDSFRPSIDARNTWMIQDSGRTAGASGRAALSWARDTLVFRPDDGDPIRVVGDLLTLHLNAAAGVGRVTFGASLPVHLVVSGTASGGVGTAVGDPGVHAKVVVLDAADRSPGLAIVGQLTVPLGGSAWAVGASSATGDLDLVLDGRPGRFHLAMNLGVGLRAPASLGELTLGHRLKWGASASLLLSDSAGLVLEVYGSTSVAKQTSGLAVTPLGTPAEALLGGWWGTSGRTVRLAAGTGVTPGIGAPTVRAALGFGIEAPRKLRDREDPP